MNKKLPEYDLRIILIQKRNNLHQKQTKEIRKKLHNQTISRNQDLRAFLNRNANDLRQILIQKKVEPEIHDLRYLIEYKKMENPKNQNLQN